MSLGGRTPLIRITIGGRPTSERTYSTQTSVRTYLFCHDKEQVGLAQRRQPNTK